MVNPVSLALHIFNLLMILTYIAIPVILVLLLVKALRAAKARR